MTPGTIPPDVLRDALWALAAIGVVFGVLLLVRLRVSQRAWAWVMVPPPPPGPAGAPEPRDPQGWGLAAGAVGLVIATRLAEPWGGAFAWFTMAPIGAAGVVAAVQILASAVAGGRGLGGARYAPVVRGVLTFAFAAIYAGWIAPHISAGAMASALFLMAVFTVLVEAAGRRRGPSAIAAAFAVDALRYPDETLLSLVAVLLALRRLRLGRARLAALGITPAAPGDLAVLPAIACSLALLAVLANRPQAPWGFSLLKDWSEPAGTVLLILVLVYLDRRLRTAEAFAAARRERAEAATPGAAP